ncbi:MAG: integrase, partial [Cyanobacteria bacterium P01_A01_bin.80]
MGLNIEDEIKALNKRLKAGGTRVTIEKRKGILLLRGTFPPKKQSPKTQPYQQRLFLGFKASRAGLRAAEQQAKIISAQLELKTFKWSDWVPEKSSHTFHISQWIKNYEKHHWEKTEKNRKSIRTWNDSYMRAFSKFLDLNQPLTIEAILNAIATTKPDTKTRQIVCMGMIKLAKFADIKEIQKIPELKGNYSPTKVHPRNLPTDTEISTSVDNIKHPGWKWLVATLATYGLRSHECF